MKSGHTARFVDCQMRGYHDVGSLSYGSCWEFVNEFITDFARKTKSRLQGPNSKPQSSSKVDKASTSTLMIFAK
jgi:hypothetical protein